MIRKSKILYTGNINVNFLNAINFFSDIYRNHTYKPNSVVRLQSNSGYDVKEVENYLLRLEKTKLLKPLTQYYLTWDSSNPYAIEVIELFKTSKKNKNMRIKFKNIAEVDFTKVFPLISKEEYELVSGQEMVVTNKTIAAIEKNKYFDIGDYKISSELIQILSDGGASKEQVAIQEVVDGKFIFAEDVVDVLNAGVELKKNVILYGKGGHGKSEITTLVLEEMYKAGMIASKPFVQAFGDGLTEDRLFGGMDIIKYKSEGKIEYLLDNSFLNHEIVVFEEIFDAPASVLLALKDIMTSGYYRNGNIQYKCKTKLFIGLTNKSKEEFSLDSDSLEALAQRFPLTLKVEWSSYTKTNFIKLFKKVFPDSFYTDHVEELSTLSDIISMNNVQGTTFVSPRTAVYAAEIYCSGRKLDYITDIDPAILAEYNKKQINSKYDGIQKKLLEKINDYINSNDLEEIDDSDKFIKELNKIQMAAGGPELDMELGTGESKAQKLSKAGYVFAVLNNVSFTTNNNQEAGKTNKQLKMLIENIKSSLTTNEKEVTNE